MTDWTYTYDEKTSSDPANIPDKIPLMSEVKNVREVETGPEKVKKLVVDFAVMTDPGNYSAVEEYSMFVSEKQGYLIRDLLHAVGRDPHDVKGHAVSTDQFRDAFKNKFVSLTFETREWQGKEFKSVKRIQAA